MFLSLKLIQIAIEIFKLNLQNQPSLFPNSFEGFIPEKHPVRLVNTIVDKKLRIKRCLI